MACSGYVCFPYKDATVITSQILSVFAFILSIGYAPTFFLGLLVMIAHQILCCCPIHKLVLWIIVVLSLVVAALNFYAAPEMMTRTTPDFCWPILTLDMMCNDTRTFFGICHYVSGSFWLLSAILNLTFLASGRHAAWNDKYFAGSSDEVVAVAVPVSGRNDADV